MRTFELEQTFLQRKYTNSQKAHKKMLNIIVRETQIKITMRYHFTLRMAILKKQNITSIGKDVRKLDFALASVAQWTECKSRWFDSQSGHMPGFQARPQ